MSKQIKKCAYYDYMLCKTFLHTLVFEDASSPLFLTYCKIDIFRARRQSFCGKFQIVCGFWNPANPTFRMYAITGPSILWSFILGGPYSSVGTILLDKLFLVVLSFVLVIPYQSASVLYVSLLPLARR